MRISRLAKCLGILAFALALFPAGRLLAGVTARISGTVTDPSGAVIAGATVVATNLDTAVTTTVTTNAQGFYSFQELPLGKYSITVAQTGFKSYVQTGIVLNVNDALVIDVALQVGQATEKVEVLSSALHVDTESTQMGEVITGKEMTDVPLVTRSYTDLAEFAARRRTDGLANDWSLRGSVHIRRFCCSIGVRRFEFRRGFRERYARVGKWIHL